MGLECRAGWGGLQGGGCSLPVPHAQAVPAHRVISAHQELSPEETPTSARTRSSPQLWFARIYIQISPNGTIMMSPKNRHYIFQSWQHGSIPHWGPTPPMAPVKAPEEPRPLAAQVPQGVPVPPSQLAGLVMPHRLPLPPSVLSQGFVPHHCEHRPDSLINNQAHVSTRKTLP